MGQPVTLAERLSCSPQLQGRYRHAIADQTQLELNAEDAAKVTGVHHIVKQSVMGADEDQASFITKDIKRVVGRDPGNFSLYARESSPYLQLADHS